MGKNSFTANQKISETTYKETYKSYKEFKLGILFILCMVGGLAYDIYNLYLWVVYGCTIINILIHIVIAAAIIGMVYPGILLIKSGGKKFLFKRSGIRFDIFPDHLSIMFTPAKGEYKNIDRVQQNIYYCDIQSMEFDDKKQRLVISSDFEEKLYSIVEDENGRKSEDISVNEVKNKAVYLYNQFDRFEEILKIIENTSPLINIQYNNRIH